MHLLGGEKQWCERADVPTQSLFSLCICCLQHKTDFTYLHQKQWLFKTGSDSLSQLYNLSVSKAVGSSRALWLAGERGRAEQLHRCSTWMTWAYHYTCGASYCTEFNAYCLLYVHLCSVYASFHWHCKIMAKCLMKNIALLNYTHRVC